MKFILSIKAVLIFASLFSQKVDTIYISTKENYLTKEVVGNQTEYLMILDSSTKEPLRSIHYLKDSFVSIEEFKFGTAGRVVKSLAEGYESKNMFVNHGINMIFFDTGSSHLEQQYVDGLLDGRQVWYNQQGDFSAIYMFKKGILNGSFIKYYESTGYVQENGNYENGCKSGLWLRFYPNKIIKDSGRYYPNMNKLFFESKKGKFVLKGLDNQVIFQIKSSKFSIDSFLTSKGLERVSKYSISWPIEIFFKDGLWKYYNENGILTSEEYYIKGRLIKKIRNATMNL